MQWLKTWLKNKKKTIQKPLVILQNGSFYAKFETKMNLKCNISNLKIYIEDKKKAVEH